MARQPPASEDVVPRTMGAPVDYVYGIIFWAMETTDWVTAGVAVLGILATAVTALLSLRYQARSHGEQMQAQERRFREAAEREHFGRLWERRQESYLKLVKWALEIRDSINNFDDPTTWSTPPPLSLETLSQVVTYADFDIFSRGEMLRGRFEQTVKNLRNLHHQLPRDSWRKMLDDIDNEAWRLVGIVREHALRPPDWREPIPGYRDGGDHGNEPQR